jgi:hypothetical protein
LSNGKESISYTRRKSAQSLGIGLLEGIIGIWLVTSFGGKNKKIAKNKT